MEPLTSRYYSKHNQDQKEYFERSERKAMVPKDSAYLRRHVDEVIRFADIRPGERVLEVGCGMGRNTLIMAKRGIQVEGMDLTPGLLDKLQECDGGKYDIPLYCTDVVEHPPELAERFDVIVGFFVLHHVHDLSACYEAMARMLKPGGRIVFLEPNPFNPLYYLQILLTPTMTWKGERGIRNMRKSLLYKVMSEAGLEEPQADYFGFFPPFAVNNEFGRTLESVLEKFPLWRRQLPFQLFKGCKSELLPKESQGF